jgi:hypothetical protein
LNVRHIAWIRWLRLAKPAGAGNAERVGRHGRRRLANIGREICQTGRGCDESEDNGNNSEPNGVTGHDGLLIAPADALRASMPGRLF